MQQYICSNCDCPIDPKSLKGWRWQGWSCKGSADHAPPRDPSVKYDKWDMHFHRDCFSEWLNNRNGFLEDLDRPLNSCKFFERIGSSMFGYYIREDKKHLCLAHWTSYNINGVSSVSFEPAGSKGTLSEPLFGVPKGKTEYRLDTDFTSLVVKNEYEFLGVFKIFLDKYGWLENQAWYEPRKPFVPSTLIADKYKNACYDKTAG